MADAKQGTQLARFWVGLERIKDELDNTLIPLAAHLDVQREDPQLDEAMQQLSQAVGEHFEKFRLVAERRAPEA
jgi:hypothetical protein